MSKQKKRHKSKVNKSDPIPQAQISRGMDWKEKAISMFPYMGHLVEEIKEEDFSIYMLFFELLPLCVEAHKADREWELQRIFDFAEWCWREGKQGDVNLSNAVGVAFYEHLRDYLPMSAIRQGVKPYLYAQLHELFEESFADRLKRSDTL